MNKKVEMIEFGGWKRCFKITHEHLSMIVTTDVGPRIIALSEGSSPSVFATVPGDAGQVGGDSWRLYGGHRLWAAPEKNPRTYFPDNETVEIAITETNVQFTAPSEHVNNISKHITITPAGTGSNAHFVVTHRIRNLAAWPIDVAAWAVSVMAANTTAVIPLSTDEPSGLLPRTSIGVWNYTRLNDSQRLTLGPKYIICKQDTTATDNNKIGARVNNGWTAGVHGTTLFVKKVAIPTTNNTVDLGCNIEVYLSPTILELETVGPLTHIEPGQCASLDEQWYLFPNVNPPTTEQQVDQHILPLVQSIAN
eukprot:gene18045-21540_t